MFESIFFAEAFEWLHLALSVRLGGYQPHYFPRLHYIARVLNSDVFPIADYVQYVRKHAYPKDGTYANGTSYQAESPIKARTGVMLLGVPVAHAGRRQRINEARISYERPWHEKHLNIIRENYQKAPYFERVFPELELLLSKQYSSLAELNMATIAWSLAYVFEIENRPGVTIRDIDVLLPLEKTRMRRMVPVSETTVPPPDKNVGRDANDWLIDMCRHFGANEYYFGGTGAACYMDFKRFEDAGIALEQQKWTCVQYPQQYGDFTPNLSIIDLVMNVSPAEARAVLHTRRE